MLKRCQGHNPRYVHTSSGVITPFPKRLGVYVGCSIRICSTEDSQIHSRHCALIIFVPPFLHSAKKAMMHSMALRAWREGELPFMRSNEAPSQMFSNDP